MAATPRLRDRTTLNGARQPRELTTHGVGNAARPHGEERSQELPAPQRHFWDATSGVPASRFEIPKDSEDPAIVVRRHRQVELHENRSDVLLDCTF